MHVGEARPRHTHFFTAGAHMRRCLRPRPFFFSVFDRGSALTRSLYVQLLMHVCRWPPRKTAMPFSGMQPMCLSPIYDDMRPIALMLVALVMPPAPAKPTGEAAAAD